jgi:acetylornithine deacetylase/succinyl-diaminopimelate desuccinylase-like protein
LRALNLHILMKLDTSGHHDWPDNRTSWRSKSFREPRICAPQRHRHRSITDSFHALEAAYKKVYGAVMLPLMSSGATDMAFLRVRGVQCYGIGAMIDLEDAPRGYGAHSDQERILEEAVYKHLQFFWNAVTSIAGSKR